MYLSSALVFQLADVRTKSTLNTSPSPSLKRWQKYDTNFKKKNISQKLPVERMHFEKPHIIKLLERLRTFADENLQQIDTLNVDMSN